MNPEVTIIISHLNSERTIRKCLDSILNQDYPKEKIHVIVVDGGSKDNSISIVMDYAQKTKGLIFQVILPKVSEAEGQIAGIKIARTEIIFFTNSDIYVPKNWIKKHLFWIGKGYDLVGGSVYWGGDKYAFSWNTILPEHPRTVQVSGLGLGFSNCSTTKEMLRRVDGLKDLASQQDTEYSFQVMKNGGKMILDPSIRIIHDHPFKSFYSEFRRAFGYSRNHIIVMKAVYGRLVFGSGYPAMVYIGIPIREIKLRLPPIEDIHTARVQGVKTNIIEYLFLSIFGKTFPTLLGAIWGSLQRNSGLNTLRNLHPEQRVIQLEIVPNTKS